MHRAIRLFVLAVAVAVLAAEVPVQAYLDPGAGSLLLQVALGGVAALGVIVKLFWRSLTERFQKRESGDKKQI